MTFTIACSPSRSDIAFPLVTVLKIGTWVIESDTVTTAKKRRDRNLIKVMEKLSAIYMVCIYIAALYVRTVFEDTRAVAQRHRFS